jgi:hypothetical protein
MRLRFILLLSTWIDDDATLRARRISMGSDLVTPDRRSGEQPILLTVVADGYPGLSSMHDLAQSLGGTLRVTSGRGAGTEVRAVMPRLAPADYGSTLSQVTSAG